MTQPTPGPTVTEWCELWCEFRIRKLTAQIKDLESERRLLRARAEKYRGLKLTEAERRATAAEPFQANPLPPSE